MRLSAYLASIIIFNPGVVIAASPANDEPSLSDTIHRCLNVPSFDASCLDIFATIIVIDDENQHKYDRDEQIAYFGRLKKSEKPPVISNFEMLGEIDNGAFASVTYRYVLTTTPNNRRLKCKWMLRMYG